MERKGKEYQRYPGSPDTMLIDALVVFVAIIAIFFLHILLEMRQLVRLGEMRRDYVREEQALLASLHEASTLGNKYHHGNGTPIRLSGTSRMASTDTAAVGSAWAL
jgi:hypothetical protein